MERLPQRWCGNPQKMNLSEGPRYPLYVNLMMADPPPPPPPRLKVTSTTPL